MSWMPKWLRDDEPVVRASMDAPKHGNVSERVGTEARRALFATGLGIGLGLIAALFGRKRAQDETAQGARWRGRSAT